MAEEPEAKKEEKQESKSKMKLFIMIGVGVLVLLILIVVGIRMFSSSGETSTEVATPQEAEEAKKETPPAEKKEMFFSFEPFIVNLQDTGAKRYLKATIELEVGSVELNKELAIRTPQLRDTILFVLTNKAYGDINTNEGKTNLKYELTSRINKILQNGSIEQLYFTDFIIQ